MMQTPKNYAIYLARLPIPREAGSHFFPSHLMPNLMAFMYQPKIGINTSFLEGVLSVTSSNMQHAAKLHPSNSNENV